MQVIGPDPGIGGDDAVHTIDVWFSRERRRWVVQRLNGQGEPIGHGHFCRSEDEARACVTDWMRRHLTTPRQARAAKAARPKDETGAKSPGP